MNLIFRRSIEICEKFFDEIVLEDQDFFNNSEKYQIIIDIMKSKFFGRKDYSDLEKYFEEIGKECYTKD